MKELESSFAVCVPPEIAQTVRKVLEDKGVWDCNRKLQRNGKSVAIPVINHDEPKLSAFLQDYPDAQVKEVSLPPSAKSVRKTEGQALREGIGNLLRNKEFLSSALLSEVPQKWERHGDLILLPSSAFTSPQWGQLGDELWQTVASALACRRLARHSTVANDGFRTPQVSMLLGKDRRVVHVDNGIRYSFDVTKCMFSSGNISEKLRVASWDCSKEVVVDLYAGIGYFTLPYLVHAGARHVHACEWNPAAVEALRGTLSLNGVADRCTVHPGDNRQLQLSCVADRVNLGLIPSSEDGWRVAARVLKSSGGTLHIHHNVTVSLTSNRQTLDDRLNGHTQGHGEPQHQQQRQRCTTEQQLTVRNGDDSSNADSMLHGNIDDSCRRSGSDRHPMTEQDERSCGRNERTGVDNCDEDDGDCVSGLTGQSETGLESDRASAGGGGSKLNGYLPWAREVCGRMKSLLQEEKGVGKGWHCRILHVEKVKSYAPHVDHVVLDLACTPRGEG